MQPKYNYTTKTFDDATPSYINAQRDILHELSQLSYNELLNFIIDNNADFTIIKEPLSKDSL